MGTNTKEEEKDTKLFTFQLDNELKEKMKDYCKNYGMTISNFLRLAIIEKLERPIGMIEETGSQHVNLVPIQTILKQLMDNQNIILQTLDFMQQSQLEQDTQELLEAKEILLQARPTTYEEATKLISDVTLMNEAMNSLFAEGKAQYKRRRIIWL